MLFDDVVYTNRPRRYTDEVYLDTIISPYETNTSNPMQNAKKLQHLVALSAFSELRRIRTRGFAPRACSRGTLREQSSSACTNDFIGILYPREQNLPPAKCSTIFNRLNIWGQAPGAN